MRALSAICLVVLMFAGCTKPTAQAPADPARVYDAPVPEGRPGDGAPEAELELPVPAPLPEGFRRIDLAPGTAVETPGIYFMDVATGKLEGWVTPLNEGGFPAYSLWASDDGRWVIANGSDLSYLIRRSSGAALRYNPTRVHLTVGPGVILARPRHMSAGDGSRCSLLDEQGRLISTFSLQDACSPDQTALFSPDGKMLALGTPYFNKPVSLVTVATGAVKGLDLFTAPSLTLNSVNFSALPKVGELSVELSLTDPAGRGYPETRVRRYTWQGELKAEAHIPGWDPSFSPDGKLLRYTEDLGPLGQAVVVQEWGAGQPLFRVPGGLSAPWVAGGGGLLVNTSKGYRLVTQTGDMSAAPGPRAFQPFSWLLPAPDQADLFLTGATVIDRAGSVRQAARVPETVRVAQARWGPTSESIFFLVMPPSGKGWDGGDLSFWLTPTVQRPPFPAKFMLKVADPKGECLNLRDEPSTNGKRIRCLPTDTRLAVAPYTSYTDIYRWADNYLWLEVETEQGERGWVAINTYSVAFSD